jgi:hypothetical protein
MSQQCPLFACPGAAGPVLLPPTESKVGTLRGSVNTASNIASHVAAVSPLCVPRRSRSCSSSPVRKQSGDIAGFCQHSPQTSHHMSQQCPLFACPGAAAPVLLPPTESKAGTLRGSVNTASNLASHVAAVSPLCVSRRSRSCSSSPGRKQSGDIAGFCQHCLKPRITCRSSVPSLRAQAQPVLFFFPRPIRKG